MAADVGLYCLFRPEDYPDISFSYFSLKMFVVCLSCGSKDLSTIVCCVFELWFDNPVNNIYPHAFRRKKRGYCDTPIRPSVMSQHCS